MGFLDFLKKVRHVEEHRIAEVYFLCEQDGVPERDLKRALIDVFRRYPDIKRIWFACSTAGGTQWTLPCAWKRMSQARPRSPRYPGNLPRYSAKTNISTYFI